ncbi:nuclear transport factor 2 family protein [Pedobacter sp.]|uniref:nuclear transport factor 2 family protein n=1 Tax=Pedobacter sp. TaxID=1411316 RepID=UPI003BABD995
MDNNHILKPSQVVKNYLDTFFSKDIEKTLDCLTDDVVWQVQGAAKVPTIGTRKGKDEVRAWLELFPVNFKPLEFKIERFFDQDDECVITGHVKHQILSTDRIFASDFAAVCRIREGKICSYKFLEDSYGLWESFQSNQLL